MEVRQKSSSLHVGFGDIKEPMGSSGEEETMSTSMSMDFGDSQLAMALGIETLQQLYAAVKERDDDQACPVTPTIFTRILQQGAFVETEVAERLFQKIDWASMQKVSWSEFCTFLNMEFMVRHTRSTTRKIVQFILPAPICALPHRDHAVRVIGTHDGLWITTSTEATVALWDNSARLKRHKLCLSKQRLKKKIQKQWITDAVLMPDFSKVLLATGDREVQFYDMASFSPFCQISGFESIPICIFYRALGKDRFLLTYGDQMGCVGIIIFHCPWKSFRMWKKLHKHEDFIPSIPIEQALAEQHVSFMRWQVHKDWVLKVKYYLETDQIVSCSKDPDTSLAIGHRRGSTNMAKLRKDVDPKAKRVVQSLYGCTRSRLPHDQIVYSISRGFTVFDFNPRMKMVATGGTDRMIRLWNCFLNKKPVALLWGHYDVIRFLYLCPQKQRLYSASADLWVKVWDVLDHTCLLTVPWHVHMVTGELRSVCFSTANDSLALVGDNIAILKLKSEEDTIMVRSHKHAVKCIVYNPLFNHIISACSGSTVRTWNLSTGRMEGEFLKAHDKNGITDMVLETTNKRLITVATDGTCKMWNYNTGLCVRTLRPAREDVEVTTVAYIDMRNVKYILTAGWSHRLNLYIDDTPETIPFEIPPLGHWRDDLIRGHQSDILCSDFSQRDKVATGDYEGQVMVWNMDTGYRTNLLQPSVPEGWSAEKLEDDKGVTCLHFLKLRSKLRRGGNLVTGGPYGHVSIWNTNFACYGSAAMATFPVSEHNTEREVVSITAVDSDTEDEVLVTGDSSGQVVIWDLQDYAIEHHEDDPPARLCTWKAHLQKVTGVKVVTPHRLVVSSSTDHTVRLWTSEGHYVGTFGQKYSWNIADKRTYEHPSIPRDIYLSQQPEDVQQHEVDLSEEQLEQESRDRPWDSGIDRGLNYFARKKAVLSKKGRHLNDETHNVFLCSSTPAPYRSLRHHDVQGPPDLPESFKARLMAKHTRQADMDSFYASE